jgi:hypothetical protein
MSIKKSKNTLHKEKKKKKRGKIYFSITQISLSLFLTFNPKRKEKKNAASKYRRLEKTQRTEIEI